MLNDVLALAIAGAILVMLATILGAVEVVRKAVATVLGR
jgi:hypothetical protein